MNDNKNAYKTGKKFAD